MIVDWGNFWTALFGALSGSGSAFILSYFYERQKQKNIEKNILIKCIYDLHTILRNISIFYKNYLMACKQNNTKIPVETLNIAFQTEKLGFICTKNPLLYESLHQFQVEYQVVKEYACTCNETPNSLYANSISLSYLAVFPKIYNTIYNVNKYLIKYYNEKQILTKYVTDNCNLAKQFFQESVQAQITEAKKQNQIEWLKHLEEIQKTENEWKIEI